MIDQLLGRVIDSVTIKVASTDTIRIWTQGEVKNPETINYRTFKPEPGGLFCQKIFGPVRDYQCACGKYKRIKYKGVVCDRCGVEVTVSSVRRERMGHIELAVPVSHIWFLKSIPSPLGLLLNMTAKSIERVLYYEQYMVTDTGNTPLEEKQLLSDKEYRTAIDEYGDEFEAKMGAEALKLVLGRMNLEDQLDEIFDQISTTTSIQKKKTLITRMRLLKGIRDSENSLDDLILETIPVIPPDLRPLVPLEGGRFATADTNDLYRRVINRNNRVKNLLQLKTPDVIIQNEKRMLQEAVDALFDNGRHGRPITGSGNRPLKSLSDMLKGKQGRFRQNLLGKRVDYSGRSVIVPGPELKINECGLPKKMALVLFEPFIIRRLKELGFVHTVRGGRKMIEARSPEIWDILEDVSQGHPVLLNRAPTLHRLSIQAFETVLIEGKAIRIHPMVCKSYNADFDGDQMAVHVPLSVEAVMEAKLLLLASQNFFSPCNGEPILIPTQDIVLGAYYLSQSIPMHKSSLLPLINSFEEAFIAWSNKILNLYDWIRLKNPDKGKFTKYGNSEESTVVTTIGRVLFNSIWPQSVGFFNRTARKEDLSNLILETYLSSNRAETVKVLDKLKEMCFEMVTKSGISIALFDLRIPDEKHKLIAETYTQNNLVEEQFREGIITRGERHRKIVRNWSNTSLKLAQKVLNSLKSETTNNESNPVYMIIDSGSRGTAQHVNQICGMKGILPKPSNEFIEKPVLNNYREGLTALDYFRTARGSRKGLAQTAIKTADAGFLERKLCDVAMDLIVTAKDDGHRNGIYKRAISNGENTIITLEERIIGRFSSDDIHDPTNPKIKLIGNGELITRDIVSRFNEKGIKQVKVMSPITSKIKNGMTVLEYGEDLTTKLPVRTGTPVGIIAGQSIGEKCTQMQLDLRRVPYPTGNEETALQILPFIQANNSGTIRINGLRSVTLQGNRKVSINSTGSIEILSPQSSKNEKIRIIEGAVIYFSDGDYINKGDKLMEWDADIIPILSEKKGQISFRDILPGHTCKVVLKEETRVFIITPFDSKFTPTISILDKGGNQLSYYTLDEGTELRVSDGDFVEQGTILAEQKRSSSKSKLVSVGMPQVVNIFECKNSETSTQGTISSVRGMVTEITKYRNKRRITVLCDQTEEEIKHYSDYGASLMVHEGDYVQKGENLTEGSVSNEEILEIHGREALQEKLIEDLQRNFRAQGLIINDKHLEIIISKMVQWITVTDSGDTDYVIGEKVDQLEFHETNEIISMKGGAIARGRPILLGITKAALYSESFLSAASFQHTTRVLTDSALLGRVDPLRGLKENIMMGNLIPVGTGQMKCRRLKVDLLDSNSSNETKFIFRKFFNSKRKASNIKETFKPLRVEHKQYTPAPRRKVKLQTHHNICPNCKSARHAIPLKRDNRNQLVLSYGVDFSSDNTTDIPLYWCSSCSTSENAKLPIPSSLLANNNIVIILQDDKKKRIRGPIAITNITELKKQDFFEKHDLIYSDQWQPIHTFNAQSLEQKSFYIYLNPNDRSLGNIQKDEIRKLRDLGILCDKDKISLPNGCIPILEYLTTVD